MSMPSPKATQAEDSDDGFAQALRVSLPLKRILVVEDDALILQLYSDVLMRSGYLVDSATDGAAGWQALYDTSCSSGIYDLLITDNSMPKMTGIEMIIKLRSEGMKLPVILATGLAPANTECLRLSAILTKPFSPIELLRTVEEVFQCAAICRS